MGFGAGSALGKDGQVQGEESGQRELGIDLHSASSHLAGPFSSLTSLHSLPLKKEPKNYMAGVWVPCQDA